MVRKQVKALTVLYLVPCQHFGVYFAPYQILLVMGAVLVLLAIPFLLFYDRTVLPLWNRCLPRQEYASIDCTGVEDALDVTMAQQTELDYLIYNDPLGVCGFDSEWRAGRIFEKYGWEPWVRRLREMPFQKQLERHFLFFSIRNLLSPQLLSDGTELLRHIRIGHCTGDIHCPSSFGGFIEPAFILHGLQRML